MIARIITQTLTDGSKVHNVNIGDGWTWLDIPCVSREHADKLLHTIWDTTDVEIIEVR